MLSKVACPVVKSWELENIHTHSDAKAPTASSGEPIDFCFFVFVLWKLTFAHHMFKCNTDSGCSCP